MKRLSISLLVITLFLVPTYSIAADKVFEAVGTITGTDSNVHNFSALKKNLSTCEATLTDLNETSNSGFDFLFWAISTSTEVYFDIIGPGSVTFNPSPGESFFATVIGTGGGDSEIGIYGIRIKCWINRGQNPND
jgi:hypothetical protein